MCSSDLTLVAAANRYKAGGKWIMLRGTAEAVKREIFRYRTRTGEYALAQTDETTRDSVLALRIETAGRRLMHTEVNESALRPHQKSGEAPVEPHTLGTASGDDGYSRLTPEKYIEVRLVDQLTYYRRKTNSLEREIQFWRWSIYIFGGVGTLLAAVGFQAVVALTAAIVTSVGAYLEFTQSEQTLTKYNQAETDLTNVQAWWQALAPDQQATQAKVDQFVDLTETILESELAGWVQQMRDTLAELHEKQAPEDEKSKNGAKNEDPKK